MSKEILYSLFVKVPLGYDGEETWVLKKHKVSRRDIEIFLNNNPRYMVKPENVIIAEPKNFSFKYTRTFNTKGVVKITDDTELYITD